MEIRVFSSIRETFEAVSDAAWDALVPADFPFAGKNYLTALASTGCLGERTGWQPMVLTAWEADDLKGAMVTFVKNNSYGEYIFDFAWAQAYEQSGLPYYPKLVAAIPFTPATGPKLLISKSQDEKIRTRVANALISGALGLSQKLNLSSIHALFIPPNEQTDFEQSGFFIRHSYQYHWRNNGYDTFADFTAQMRSRRRKELNRERRLVSEGDVKIKRLTGDQLKPEHADIMYRFYRDTVGKRGGFEYLTREFFREVFRTMSDNVLFVVAENGDGKIVAGALNYFGEKTLYGRNWGCLEDYKFLHFELCYYQGIEFAIEKKFDLFEAGAQGEHKFQRGFLPSLTYSAHHLEHSELVEPVRAYVENEKRRITALFIDYEEHSPFSKECSSP